MRGIITVSWLSSPEIDKINGSSTSAYDPLLISIYHILPLCKHETPLFQQCKSLLNFQMQYIDWYKTLKVDIYASKFTREPTNLQASAHKINY
jgi:hypothetical protein